MAVLSIGGKESYTTTNNTFQDNTSNLQGAGINLSNMFNFLQGSKSSSGSTSAWADNTKDQVFSTDTRATSDLSSSMAASLGLGLGSGASGSGGQATSSRGETSYDTGETANNSKILIFGLFGIGIYLIYKFLKRK